MDAHIVENQELKSPTLWLYYYYNNKLEKIYIIDQLALHLDEHVQFCLKNVLTPSFRGKVAPRTFTSQL